MIWSATPYNGEADVLEIRLGTLPDVHHVIAEGNRTQHGDPKPFYFEQHAERFQPWADRITYLRFDLDDGEGERADWQRERALRDGLLEGLGDVEDDDLVLLSDVDEIPRPEALQEYGEPMRLEMDMHVYSLNWRWRERPVRYGTRATLVSGSFLPCRPPSQHVEAGCALSGPAGWHLSYQGDAEAIRAKILSIADDFRRADFLDLDHLEHCRQTGADLFKRDFRQCEWCPESELPPYVLENRERFAHMLIPEPVEAAA